MAKYEVSKSNNASVSKSGGSKVTIPHVPNLNGASSVDVTHAWQQTSDGTFSTVDTIHIEYNKK